MSWVELATIQNMRLRSGSTDGPGYPIIVSIAATPPFCSLELVSGWRLRSPSMDLGTVWMNGKLVVYLDKERTGRELNYEIDNLDGCNTDHNVMFAIVDYRMDGTLSIFNSSAKSWHRTFSFHLHLNISTVNSTALGNHLGASDDITQ